MKKIKIFLMTAVMALSLTCLTVAYATEKPCVPYSIICDGGSFHGTVCGDTVAEMIGKVWDIAEILCD
ncbi:MAG: hypothetical protein LBH91_00875 [Prevotellaceae bacterium]|jgi:hypothetical protein|nr:hypothetical protein [Prevotellaceae bacterium]